FAENVPQGDVGAAQGMDGRAAPPEIDGSPVHLLPQPLDVQRVFADEQFPDAAGDAVRERGFKDGLRDMRRRVHLAQSDDSGIGMYLDQQRVLRAVALGLDFRQAQVNRFDFGDFHKRGSSYGSLSLFFRVGG